MGEKVIKILVALLLLVSIGCVKDKPPAVSAGLPGSSRHVFIVCEGNFGSGNGSLYVWQPDKDSVFGDVYAASNAGATLGDVFQSMTRIGGNYFLCINNSDKVVVIDTASFKFVGSVSVPQPRYIMDLGNHTAWVSSMYHSAVFELNTQSLQFTDTLPTAYQNTEGMCRIGGTEFVCTWDTASEFLSVFSSAASITGGKIRVAGYAPQEVLVDKQQTLGVLSGNQPEGRTAVLTHIDPSTGAILDSFTFPTTANPVRPVMNNSGDTLYFIGADYYLTSGYNGIFRMSIYDKSLPTVPFIEAGAFSYFWALGIDPHNGDIYVGDPKMFSQRGVVSVYRPDGTRIDSFKVGLGPGHFYFN